MEEKHKKEIEKTVKEMGFEAGKGTYLPERNAVLTSMVDKIREDERELAKYEAEVEEWEKQGPPPTIKAR